MSIATERAALFAQGLNIVKREDWGAAQSYLSARTVVTPAKGFFLHISVTIDGGDLPADEHAAMRTIERIGQQRFGIGFPYNAAAFDTGRLYEGQPLGRRGAHTVNDLPNPSFKRGSLNYDHRALVLPQMVDDDVTDAQIDAAARWAAAQIRAGLAVRGARWSGHRDVTRKGCPGDAGYARLPELNRLTAHYEAVGLADTPTPEEPSMVIIIAPGGSVYVCTGGKLIWVEDPKTLNSAPAAIPRWQMRDLRTWENFTKALEVVK